MNLKAIIVAFGLVAVAASSQANAAGCLKGAAAGGVAGHFVGSGHAVIGAVGGCIAGRHLANKKAKEDAAARAQVQQGQGAHPSM